MNEQELEKSVDSALKEILEKIRRSSTKEAEVSADTNLASIENIFERVVRDMGDNE